ATLEDASLARQAGRFVWLELDYDRPENQAFIARQGAAWTPAFYIVDPADERATATHIGGMGLAELDRFLGAGGAEGRGAAVHAGVPRRAAARDRRACAEPAARAAPALPRDRSFASLVHMGLGCANGGDATPWATRARKVIEPLAEEALGIAAALRDDRFEL